MIGLAIVLPCMEIIIISYYIPCIFQNTNDGLPMPPHGGKICGVFHDFRFISVF